jgi:hypothetical protein
MLDHWNNSLWIEMSPHSNTLSWFRANSSLFFHYDHDVSIVAWIIIAIKHITTRYYIDNIFKTIYNYCLHLWCSPQVQAILVLLYRNSIYNNAGCNNHLFVCVFILCFHKLHMGRIPNYGRNSNILIPDPYH